MNGAYADSIRSRRVEAPKAYVGPQISLVAHLGQLGGLAGILSALGTPAFYSSLVGWIESTIPSDFWFVADYSPNDKPTIIQDTWKKSDAKSFYFTNVCQFDPVFYALGNQALMQGTSISMMRRQFDIDPRYADYMKNVAHIADELMILLPQPGGSCMALCLDREEQAFSQDEVEYARTIFALLSELALLHAEKAGAPGAARRRFPSEHGEADFVERVESFSRSFRLTAREAEIARLSLSGHPSAAIARTLGISAGSVRNHKLRLYRKLDITSEREMLPLFFDRFNDAGLRGAAG